MKKLICLLAATLLLCGCSANDYVTNPSTESFTENEQGNLVSPSGTQYVHLANEGSLYYLGELEFLASVAGEEKESQHKGIPYQTGMFAIKGAANDNILVRRQPDNEWFSIYQKASLPALNYSADNCIRLEFVSNANDSDHRTCGGGITDKAEIVQFLSEIRSQKSPRDAGLYDLVKKTDGMLENCYVCGKVYGFFADEPNVAIQMEILSFNDQAHSITVEDREYVLPEAWFSALENAQCAP